MTIEILLPWLLFGVLLAIIFCLSVFGILALRFKGFQSSVPEKILNEVFTKLKQRNSNQARTIAELEVKLMRFSEYEEMIEHAERTSSAGT